MGQWDWKEILVRIAVVLGALLVLLVSLALLYILVQVLRRFGDILALFILGAIIAYVLNPAVSWIASRAGKRWMGTLVVYAGAAAVLAILAVVLLQPLVSESASLVRSLRNPTSASMRAVSRIAEQSHATRIELRSQRDLATEGKPIPQEQVRLVHVAIAGLEGDLAALGASPPHQQPHPDTTKRGVAPQAQVRVPPSYLAPLESSTAALASDYRQAIFNPAAPSLSAVSRSIADANRITSQAKALHKTLSTTPILLLNAQTWLDEHHIGVNVSQWSTQVVQHITSQVSSLLNNTAAILSQTGTLLLDAVLVLMISVYFVADGERMMHQAAALVPATYKQQASFFMASLDSVLGGYIRAQMLLALMAGVLAGVGAAVLGVPFALIIGVSTFVLQLVPVIGPMLIYVVPVTISLLFTTMPTPLVLFGYLIVLEQVVTNVIGPRVNSKSVGIHPLEAMAGALVGYSMGGVLGSFLAVPFVGLVHVVVKEAYTSRRAGNKNLGTAAAGTSPTQNGTLMHVGKPPTTSGTSPNGTAEQETVTAPPE